ncbi:MAG: sulfur carrier protein ThiS [Kiloniellaceae bacterium]
MSATIRLNGQERQLGAGTLIGLLREQNIDLDARGVAVALNGAVVPRRAWRATALTDGDEVEIVKLFAGG